MRFKDEIYIAVMTLLFCCAMFVIYAVVPQDAAVASKARATVTEAPETAAEAEALRSSLAEDAGFTIYTEESNYDYTDSDTYDTDTSDTYTDTYEPVYTPSDTNDAEIVDEGSYDPSDYNPSEYDPSDQITYPSDTDYDTDYDTSQDTEYFPDSTDDYFDDYTYEGSDEFAGEDIYTEY